MNGDPLKNSATLIALALIFGVVFLIWFRAAHRLSPLATAAIAVVGISCATVIFLVKGP